MASDVGRVQTGLGEQGSVWVPPGAEEAFVLWALGARPHHSRPAGEKQLTHTG